MPIYEYQCDDCRYYLEVMQKIADPPLKKCPSCGHSALTKLISAPAFRLKGSGWYETDFKSEQERKRPAEETAEPKAASETPAAKSETKTETARRPGRAEGKPSRKPSRRARPRGRRTKSPCRRLAPRASGGGPGSQAGARTRTSGDQPLGQTPARQGGSPQGQGGWQARAPHTHRRRSWLGAQSGAPAANRPRGLPAGRPAGSPVGPSRRRGRR